MMERRASNSGVVRSSKRLKSEEEQVDRISQLPESILVHILSFLPTKDVVKLERVPRFMHVWTYIRNLSFDQCQFHNHRTYRDGYYDGTQHDDRFLRLIRYVLMLHESETIDEFHLKFGFNLLCVTYNELDGSDYASIEKNMALELSTWIMFVARKRVKVLDLNLLGCTLEEEVRYKLPNIVLTSNDLMELMLAGCGIKEYGQIKLTSLRKLSLKEILLSENIMSKILKGCPLLEELSLIRCSGVHKLKLTNPRTKRLSISIGWRYEMMYSKLEIICPHITSLEISGPIQHVDLNASSSVVDASLYYKSRFFRFARKRYNRLRTLLWQFTQSGALVLCSSTILVFTIWAMTNMQSPLFSSRSLVLRLRFTKWHLPGICNILRNSAFLETLTFCIYPGSHSIFSHNEASWIMEHNFDAPDYWKSQEPSFPSVMLHLKTVKIYGYITEPLVFELIEFLLKKALVLEKMVISTKKILPFEDQDDRTAANVVSEINRLNSDKLFELSQKLLSLPRASTSAVIQFYPNDSK